MTYSSGGALRLRKVCLNEDYAPGGTALTRKRVAAEKTRSAEEPGQLLAQPGQHAEPRRMDGPYAKPQFRRDLGRRPAFHDERPARLPGRGPKVGAHDLQGPADNLLPVLALPEGFPFRRRHVVGPAHLDGRHGVLPPALAPLVEGDGAEPAAEALVPVVGELGQLADEDGEHLLHEVGGVVRLEAAAPRPVVDQRRVQIDEPGPGGLLVRAAQSLQK